eukprot:1142734-Pelagomonas_calceolata.AAC.2
MARPISMPAKQPYDCHCQPKEKGEHFCWCVSACMHDGGRSWQGKGPRAQQHMLQQSRRHTSTCCSKQEAQQHMLQQAGGTAAQVAASRRHSNTCCSKQDAQQHKSQQAGGTAAHVAANRTGNRPWPRTGMPTNRGHRSVQGMP